MTKLFGTDGIRGIFGREITEDLAFRVGCALVDVLDSENPKILIGWDTRESSFPLAKAISKGIQKADAESSLAGICTTPEVAYLVKLRSFDAGIMISASHNPHQYNGIKIFGPDGFKLSDELEERIESLVFLEEKKKGRGRITELQDVLYEYIHYLKDCCNISLDGLNIGIDTANGSASVCAEKLFSFLGAKCLAISDSPNGRNINDSCGATNTEKLRKYVIDHSLDAGFAFDGDADRCIAIDEKGKEVDGDFILAILSLWLKEKGLLKNNILVGTVMSNLGLHKFCERENITFISAPVGDRYVLELMEKEGAILGGEQSGHIILRDYATTGDGLLTAVMLLKRIKESGKSLSALAAVMWKYPQYSSNVKADQNEKLLFSNDEKIQSIISKVKEENPSCRLVRIMAEGEDEVIIKNICNRLSEDISRRLGDLNNSVR